MELSLSLTDELMVEFEYVEEKDIFFEIKNNFIHLLQSMQHVQLTSTCCLPKVVLK